MHVRGGRVDEDIALLSCQSFRLQKKLEQRVMSPTKLDPQVKLQKVICAEKYDPCNNLSLVSVFTHNHHDV